MNIRMYNVCDVILYGYACVYENVYVSVRACMHVVHVFVGTCTRCVGYRFLGGVSVCRVIWGYIAQFLHFVQLPCPVSKHSLETCLSCV